MVKIIDGAQFLKCSLKAQLYSLIQSSNLKFLLNSSNTAAQLGRCANFSLWLLFKLSVFCHLDKFNFKKRFYSLLKIRSGSHKNA
jgi:hypothetical protein